MTQQKSAPGGVTAYGCLPSRGLYLLGLHRFIKFLKFVEQKLKQNCIFCCYIGMDSLKSIDFDDRFGSKKIQAIIDKQRINLVREGSE